MSSVPPPHYVKLRRYNLSIFVHCDVHTDTVQAIKERYGKLVGHIFYNCRLYLGQQCLDDFLTLYGCGIESEGAELTVVHSKEIKNDGTGEHIWESVEEAMMPPKELTQTGEGSSVPAEKSDADGTAAPSNEASGQKIVDTRNVNIPEHNVEFVGV